MNCEEFHRLVHAYADDELDPLRSEEAEQHLQSCRACAAAYENLRALKRSAKAASVAAPAGLLEEVLTILQLARTPATITPRRDLRPWLLTGLAIAASVLLGFFLGQRVSRSSDHTLVTAIVDNHIRSLVGTHLVDVTSSDQHTVRPWFEGKLDFAPPVMDLSQDEFPLRGGRVEYIDGRPVAALVYERRKHFINLFIWPASGEVDSPAATKPQRGYNVLRWRSGGMNFWAVSEVSENDLRKFAAAFSGATGPSR
ncbi:MAG: anti-sigma factor [Chthoniobacterales bacterium]